MLYDEYRLKMARLAKFLSILNKFRVLILSILFAVIALTASLMGVCGLVFDTVACPKSIVVGEPFVYTANAIFKKVTYEFSVPDSNEWTTVQPTRPGTYLVRTYSKNVFGGNRYGDTYHFTIEPKRVVVKTVEEKIMYGFLPTVSSDGLCFEDTISCTKFIYGNLCEQTSTIKADVEAITATDKDGNDVTSSYVFLPFEGAITFEKRPLSIIFGDYKAEYNGQTFLYKSYTIASDTPLAEGDVESIQIECGANVGEIEVDPKVHVINLGLGNSLEEAEVTANYDINIIKNKGIVEIQERPIYITTENATKVYDGQPLTNAKYILEQDSKAFLENLGHRLEVITTTQVTNVTSENGIDNIILKFAVYDKDGNDLTKNYKILNKDGYGKLSVTPRKVVIQSVDDSSQVFDGTEKTSKYFSTILYEDSYDIVDGDEARVIESTYQILAGDYKNEIKVAIYSSKGDDISSNYEIIYKYGVFTIRPRPVYIATQNAEWVYDGVEHTTSEYQVREGGAIDGHQVQGTTKSKITDAGTVINDMTFVMYDSEQNIVTQNYEFHITAGTLTVHRRPIDIAAETKDKVYDGIPLSGPNLVLLSTDYALVEGHTLNGETEGEQTEVGESANKIKDLTQVKVLNAQGEDKTANYEITNTTEGKLTVYYREITITANSAEKVYDGVTLKDENYVLDGGVMEGHTLTVVIAGEITNSGKVENAIASKQILDGEKDITKNYKIYEVAGELSILPRPITVETQDKSFIYDNEIHTHGGFDISGDYGIVEGQTTEVSELAQIQTVSQNNVRNTMNLSILSGEEDVTSNYTITYKYGALSIIPRPIEITTATASQDYDDSILSDENYEVTSELTFLPIHEPKIDSTKTPSLQYVEFDEQGEVTSIDNALVIKVYDGENDVSENYNLIYTYGTLTVNIRKIVVLTGSRKWVYDGMEHELREVGVDNLPEKFVDAKRPIPPTITNPVPIILQETSETKTTIVKDVGTYPNKLSGGLTILKVIRDTTPNTQMFGAYANSQNNTAKFELQRMQGNKARAQQIIDISKNFELTHGEDTGTLEVVPRKIKLKVADATKVYDATAVTAILEKQKGEYVPYEEEYTPLPKDDGYIPEQYRSWNINEAGDMTLFASHRFAQMKLDGEQINVGSSVIAVDSIQVVDISLNEYTTNYKFISEGGTHTVTPRPIELQPLPKTKEYDGLPLISEQQDIKWNYVGGDEQNTGLLAGHRLINIEYLSTITEVGEVIQDIVEVQGIVAAKIITDSEVDVTTNYDISHTTDKLTVTHREITLTVDDGTKIYDAQPLTKNSYTLSRSDGEAALVVPQTIDNTRLVYPDVITNVGITTNTVMLESIHIVDNGVEYTHNYAITIVDGTLTVEKRPITVTTHDKEFIYDALEHWFIDYEVENTAENSGIVTGQTHSADNSEDNYTKVIDYTPIAVDNVFAIKIFENTTETTSNYEITYIYGKLTVNKRLVYFKTFDDEFVYDGIPKSSREKRIEEVVKGGNTGLVTVGGAKHRFYVENNDWATITNVYENAEGNNIANNVHIKYTTGGSFIDVTGNYNIIVEKYGTLKITPRLITVVADNDELVYNGNEQYGTKFKTAGDSLPLALLTQKIKATTNEQGKVVGEYTITIKLNSATIVGDDIRDTQNYTILYDTTTEATLTIIKRDILFNSDSQEWVYDANVHYNKNITVSPSSKYILAKTGGTLHTTRVDEFATIKDVLYKYNGENVEVDSKENKLIVSILCGSEDVTSNYNIAYNYGKLTVQPRPITIQANDKEGVYNADPLTQPMYSCNYKDPLSPNPNSGLLDNIHRLVAKTEGEQTDVGTHDNIIKDDSVVITDKVTGDNVTPNYAITLVKGTLTVTPRPINITYLGKEWTYDGTIHYHREFTVEPPQSNSGLVQNVKHNHIAVASTVDGTFATVSTVDNGEVENAMEIHIFTADGRDVTENYEMTVVEKGILKITPRPIYITTANKEWIYDGKAHSYPVISLIPTDENSGLVVGQSVVISNEQDPDRNIVDGATTVTNVGEYQNVLYFGIVDGDENIVTINYDLEPLFQDEYGVIQKYPLYGTLKIISREITIVTEGKEWQYDGNTHSNQVYELKEGSMLAEGHTIKASNWAAISIGEAENVATITILDENNIDVTSNYTITLEKGLLKVVGDPNQDIPPDSILGDYKDKVIYIKPVDKVDVYRDGFVLRADNKFEENTYTRELQQDLGYTCIVTCSGSQSTIGSSKSYVTSFSIYQGSVNVTDEFKIEYLEGDLTLLNPEVTKKILTVNYSSQVVYDGNRHSFDVDSFMLYDDGNITWDYELTVEIDPSVGLINAQTISSGIFKRRYVDTNLIRFTLTTWDGVLLDTESGEYYLDYDVIFEISRRILIITTPSQSRPYNGTPLTNTNCLFGGEGIVEGHTTQVVGTPRSITEIDEVFNVVKIGIFNGSDNVTGNYRTVYNYGKLKVTG